MKECGTASNSVIAVGDDKEVFVGCLRTADTMFHLVDNMPNQDTCHSTANIMLHTLAHSYFVHLYSTCTRFPPIDTNDCFF